MKLPKLWQDTETIVRWDSTVLWQSDGWEECEFELYPYAFERISVEFGGDWKTADDEDFDDPAFPVSFRQLRAIERRKKRGWRYTLSQVRPYVD